MRSTVAVTLVTAGLAAVSARTADDAPAELFYIDEDESAACMACRAEIVGYCVPRGECAYPISGEKRVCDSPHDHIAASAAEAEWFCEQYGDELLHSDCGAALESDDAAGIGRCTDSTVRGAAARSETPLAMIARSFGFLLKFPARGKACEMYTRSGYSSKNALYGKQI